MNELTSAGGRVNEQERLNYLLRNSPDSLIYTSDMINTMWEKGRINGFFQK